MDVNYIRLLGCVAIGLMSALLTERFAEGQIHKELIYSKRMTIAWTARSLLPFTGIAINTNESISYTLGFALGESIYSLYTQFRK